MADLDRDLLAIQEVRTLLRRAHEAQQAFERFDQASVDRVTKAMVEAGARAAEPLAKLAVEETGYGRVDSKTLKNLFATEVLWESIRDLKTVGIVRRDEANGVYEVAAPYGVVASIIPTTNPTSTALFKGIVSVKARNATVMSPHPRSVRCIRESCRVLNDAAVRAGAPDGLVLSLSEPTLESTRELMHHRLTNVILATGGAGLVKAAYSSGKPAYGVGPGNVPAYVERTADVEHAVRCIVSSQTFDWSTICASEQSVIVDREIADATLAEFRRQGAHFCSEDETRALERLCVRGELMNPEIVGMAPVRLAALAGFRVPESTTVLLAPQGGVGPKYPLSREILTPLLAWYVVKDWREGCRRCIEVLEFGGDGHTLGLHTRSEEVATAFALEKPANRILVNAPTSQGSVGLATNVEASMTLGCGPMGRNISSDNITARHLVNLKRVAIVRPDWWDIEARYAAGRRGVEFPVARSRHLVTPEGGSGERRAQEMTIGGESRHAAYGGYGGNARVTVPDEPPAWSAARFAEKRGQTPVPADPPMRVAPSAPAPSPKTAVLASADPVVAALLGQVPGGAPASTPSAY
ncbi:MAG TPA: aldehyde dehydrogenase family protein [Planctomycetota bacterium]|nr:aldehyde dehydrogenase family protein [Planctomycetota bacterium]